MTGKNDPLGLGIPTLIGEAGGPRTGAAESWVLPDVVTGGRTSRCRYGPVFTVGLKMGLFTVGETVWTKRGTLASFGVARPVALAAPTIWAQLLAASLRPGCDFARD